MLALLRSLRTTHPNSIKPWLARTPSLAWSSQVTSTHVEPIDEEDSLSGYHTSRYCPVKLGDRIRDTYTVKVKLGFGRGSTTWLCTDEKESFRVLKISTSNNGRSSREASVFEYLRKCAESSQDQAQYTIRMPEDMFSISANGETHQCFVFEPLGPSLLEFSFRKEQRRFGTYETRWVATYLLHALRFLHSHGVVHTDIKLDNIQLTPPEDGTELLKSLVAAEAKDPSIYKTTPDGSRIYKSREMQQDELTFPILCDMDSAEFGKATHSRLAQALPYRAPEVLLGAAWDCKIDIWNLGVLICELLLAQRLYGPSSEHENVRLMLQYMGSPSRSFLQRCSKTTPYFDAHGSWRHGEVSHMPLETCVETDLDPSLFFDFVNSMLRWDPEERQSASELLKHPWLSDG